MEKLNYKIPILIEKTDVREIFDKLISYINKQETGQNSLFDELSWGLSAKKESLKILDELIYKATNKKMNDYLFKSRNFFIAPFTFGCLSISLRPLN